MTTSELSSYFLSLGGEKAEARKEGGLWGVYEVLWGRHGYSVTSSINFSSTVVGGVFSLLARGEMLSLCKLKELNLNSKIYYYKNNRDLPEY